MPTVKEECLDETVWSAVTEAVLNPATILDQVSKLQEKEIEVARINSTQAQTVGRALEQVRKEETRLLEAYRTGIISPAQLGRELEQLKQRQSALEVRSASLLKPSESSGSNNLRRTLEEYCQKAAERLQTFDNGERQRFLRLLVDNVIFEGAQVRIRAVIPLNNSAQTERSGMRQIPEMSLARESVNATTNTDYYGRNSVLEFELTKPIIKPAIMLPSRNALGRYIPSKAQKVL
jgi:hypothetical protein